MLRNINKISMNVNQSKWNKLKRGKLYLFIQIIFRHACKKKNNNNNEFKTPALNILRREIRWVVSVWLKFKGGFFFVVRLLRRWRQERVLMASSSPRKRLKIRDPPAVECQSFDNAEDSSNWGRECWFVIMWGFNLLGKQNTVSWFWHQQIPISSWYLLSFSSPPCIYFYFKFSFFGGGGRWEKLKKMMADMISSMPNTLKGDIKLAYTTKE